MLIFNELLTVLDTEESLSVESFKKLSNGKFFLAISEYIH